MVTIGIVGCGYWGPNLIRNFYATDQVHFKWACDLVEKNLQKISGQYPTIQTTTDFSNLLNDSELDAIIVATPVESHFKLAALALEAGKHVLVEKPMAATTTEAEQLVMLAKEHDRILAVDHTFLFTGAVKKIRELIQSDELGDILYFDSVRINLGLIRHDINVIWDLAPHDISILLHVINKKPVSVQATGINHIGSGLEEIAYLTVKFEDNVIGHIHVSWLSPVKVRNITIGGSKKMLQYDDVEPTEKIKIYDKGVNITPEMRSGETPFTPIYRAGDILIPKIETTEPLAAESAHFIACVEGREKPLSDGTVGLDVVRVLEAANQSLSQKSKEIAL